MGYDRHGKLDIGSFPVTRYEIDMVNSVDNGSSSFTRLFMGETRKTIWIMALVRSLECLHAIDKANNLDNGSCPFTRLSS